MRPATEVFFMQAPVGQRLCLHHAPAGGSAQAAVVHVHPWAEELNKSRRMAALTARRLAAEGVAVLQIDLHGCGDSSGDFGDASWADWLDDIRRAAAWMRARHGAPLWLWGHRAGALLAVQAAQTLAPCQFLFWQPAPAGKPLLQQFLRLKAAADLAQASASSVMQALRRELDAGRAVDVAGYRVAAALAIGLEAAQLDAPAEPSRAVWLELSTRDGADLLPASRQRIDAWRGAGHEVDAAVVSGPAFWQTQEVEDAPALIDATVAALTRRTVAA